MIAIIEKVREKMPTKFKNVDQIFIKTTDGTIINLDNIREIDLEQESDYSDYLFESTSIIQAANISCKITVKNDRNRTTKRYRKNRKGYRGLCDLLI